MKATTPVDDGRHFVRKRLQDVQQSRVVLTAGRDGDGIEQRIGVVGVAEAAPPLRGVGLVLLQADDGEVPGTCDMAGGSSGDRGVGEEIEPRVGEAEADEDEAALAPEDVKERREWRGRISLPVLVGA
jgi:hypothetical protein